MSRFWSRHVSVKLYCCVIVCKIAVADCRAFGFPPNLSNLLSQMQLKSPPKMFSSVAQRKLESVAKSYLCSVFVLGAYVLIRLNLRPVCFL